MNESETRSLVERFIRAANAADHEAMVACLAEDAVYDAPDGERLVGRENFRWKAGLDARDRREQFGDLVVMTSPDGGRAAAEYTLRGTLLAGEGRRDYSVPGGMFFEIEDGLIARVTAYRKPAG